MKNFTLTIRTPDREIYSGKVDYVKLVTDLGLIKILPGHADMVATVTYTPVQFHDDENREFSYIVKRGLARISLATKSMELMVFDAFETAEADEVSIKEYLEFLENELKKGNDLSDFKIKYLTEEKIVIEKQLNAKSKN